MLPPGNRKDMIMAKKITITFPQGGIIPGSILKEEKDRHVPAMESIAVPEAYGRHLIADRFAVEAARPEEKTKKASPSGDTGAAAAVAKMDEAHKAVSDAKAKIIAAGDDVVKKADAEQDLATAEAALAALKA